MHNILLVLALSCVILYVIIVAYESMLEKQREYEEILEKLEKEIREINKILGKN